MLEQEKADAEAKIKDLTTELAAQEGQVSKELYDTEASELEVAKLEHDAEVAGLEKQLAAAKEEMDIEDRAMFIHPDIINASNEFNEIHYRYQELQRQIDAKRLGAISVTNRVIHIQCSFVFLSNAKGQLWWYPGNDAWRKMRM